LGQGADGREGVASAVEKPPNTVSYVEFVHAIPHQFEFGAAQNSSGRFVRASLNSLAEAARTLAAESSSDSYASITKSPDKEAYPVASLTWLLIPEQIVDPQKKQALLELLRCELTSGQKDSSAQRYAPLPAEMTSQQLDLLHKIE
jgi:phosphate transport system substrate-binding protein